MMGRKKPASPRIESNGVDRDAFERAIAMAKERDETDCLQIEEMLQERPWREVGEFAAYSCQCDRLGLRPWQAPPCMMDGPDVSVTGDDVRGYRDAAHLLGRLLELGLSRWEPDPLAAIAAAERIEAAE
jgi:hypothetical protein